MCSIFIQHLFNVYISFILYYINFMNSVSTNEVTPIGENITRIFKYLSVKKKNITENYFLMPQDKRTVFSDHSRLFKNLKGAIKSHEGRSSKHELSHDNAGSSRELQER